MFTNLYAKFATLCTKYIPYDVTAFVCRVAAAFPFWKSGQSKLDGGSFAHIHYELFNIKASKIYLFANEFGFGDTLAPAAAQMAALGENLLPPLLVFGLLTRIGAGGLLLMTAVIQFFVFPEELIKLNGNWTLHMQWIAPLLVILSKGPGRFSLDWLFGKNLQKNR